jgi:hypothetical protein
MTRNKTKHVPIMEHFFVEFILSHKNQAAIMKLTRNTSASTRVHVLTIFFYGFVFVSPALKKKLFFKKKLINEDVNTYRFRGEKKRACFSLSRRINMHHFISTLLLLLLSLSLPNANRSLGVRNGIHVVVVGVVTDLVTLIPRQIVIIYNGLLY